MPEGAHDWFRPKLAALMADAQAAGYGRDVAVAVITDLVNGPLGAISEPPPDEEWNRDIGEPDSAVNGTPASDPSQGPRFEETLANPLQQVGRRGYTSRPR